MFSVQTVFHFLCCVIRYDGRTQFYVESPWHGGMGLKVMVCSYKGLFVLTATALIHGAGKVRTDRTA